MRHALLVMVAVVMSGLGVAAIAADSSSDNDKAADAIRKLEQKWGAAAAKKDTGPMEEMLADDYCLTSPDGHLVSKNDFIERIKDGTFVIDSLDYSDMKVRIWDKTAVVTGRITLKAKWADNDIGGQYAFTDTFINRDNKWLEVAGQVTKVEE